MEYKNKLILVEKPRKNVALITLNNPPLNLVTLDLSAELRETLFKLEQDDEVRVIVLTGSGQRAFCVGSDVKEFPQVWDDVIGKKLQKENETFNCIEFLEKPVIAAMEGTVCGGGYEMAMACDLRIMSDISKIAQPEINLGVFPGSGGLFRLPRAIGQSAAMEVILTGEPLPAERAYALGLAAGTLALTVASIPPFGLTSPEALNVSIASSVICASRCALCAFRSAGWFPCCPSRSVDGEAVDEGEAGS